MKFKFVQKQELNKLPQTTGVYCFIKFAETRSLQTCRDRVSVGFLYIGKAVNIRQRVKNHFQQPVFKDSIFIPLTNKIGYIETNSEIEALLLEAELIKKHKPKYNTLWKDDKNYHFIEISKEEFPRVFVSHGSRTISNFQFPTSNFQKQKKLTNEVGPFVDGISLKQTLRLLRKIFPFRTCRTLPKKPCLYKELGLCLAPCNIKTQIENLKSTSKILNLKKEYRRNINSLKDILLGKSRSVLMGLKKEMAIASKKQDFERAKGLRDKIFTLEKTLNNAHILSKKQTLEKENNWQTTAKQLAKILSLNGKRPGRFTRIEGYDISNIQGKQATGSLVVFENGKPNKNQYRKFKIRLKQTPDDTAMLKEILTRRFKHQEWPLPQVILIDGGIGQLNVALKLKVQSAKLKVKIQNSKLKNIKFLALAKRNNELFLEGRQKPLLLKDLPSEVANLILQVRDEAHRFAISYHKKLRSKALLGAE